MPRKSSAKTLLEAVVTVDQVMSWEPCSNYSCGRVKKLFAGRQSISASEILALGLPAEDKLWAVLREEVLSPHVLHEFACRYAEHILLKEHAAGREPDARSRGAIAAKRRWLRGELTDSELAAAWVEARMATRFFAGTTAWAAAGVAAKAAARAAGTAAWAAMAAAMTAARNAASDEQIDILKRLLKEQN